MIVSIAHIPIASIIQGTDTMGIFNFKRRFLWVEIRINRKNSQSNAIHRLRFANNMRTDGDYTGRIWHRFKTQKKSRKTVGAVKR